jgi:hypothetical protein
MKRCRNFGHEYEDSKKQCPICKRHTQDRWTRENKHNIKEYQQNYAIENKEYIAERKKQWQTDNKDRERKNMREYNSKRRKEDTLYKMSRQIRSRISQDIRNAGYSKSSKTANILGCDFEKLQDHLITSAFRNYGCYSKHFDYHIDHIIPVSSANTEEELLALNHYTNLQILYPEDNLSKKDKLNWKLGE